MYFSIRFEISRGYAQQEWQLRYCRSVDEFGVVLRFERIIRRLHYNAGMMTGTTAGMPLGVSVGEWLQNNKPNIKRDYVAAKEEWPRYGGALPNLKAPLSQCSHPFGHCQTTITVRRWMEYTKGREYPTCERCRV